MTQLLKIAINDIKKKLNSHPRQMESLKKAHETFSTAYYKK